MLFIQMTGLSGSGKTTLAYQAKNKLIKERYQVEVIDGDEFRRHLCSDLGFSKADRIENIRRLGRIGHHFAYSGVIAIMSAINPIQQIREELITPISRLVWIDCSLEIVRQRDTKGLYNRADLPVSHPGKIKNLSGYGDVFETPTRYDLRIDTSCETEEKSTQKFLHFILAELQGQKHIINV